ncbi:unnamed protein product [Tilletia controversa]|nr:hypothetical protein CF336_g6881 [Tilletia laevis]CAD6892485.1 unnamed protein product [Tilletia caries]CAD6899306.1 unnamed protein product [Tilletia controversa]CAD6909884.1 unnamed protein product [Tilletia caries]CAD7066440.1 unnamed protein product [Tilletia caries]
MEIYSTEKEGEEGDDATEPCTEGWRIVNEGPEAFAKAVRAYNEMINNTSYPDKAIHEFSTKAVECGLDIFRVFDSLNNAPPALSPSSPPSSTPPLPPSNPQSQPSTPPSASSTHAHPRAPSQGLLYLVPLHLQGRQSRLDGDELGAEGGEFVGLGRGAFAEGGNSGLFGV